MVVRLRILYLTNNGSIEYYGQPGSGNIVDCLPQAEDAPFNSYAEQHESACLANTRVDLLEEIYSWGDGEDQRCIFWLSGQAGTGKSIIARTVARLYDDKQRLAASFFFSRGGGDVSHAGKFVTSIAAQLAQIVSGLQQYVGRLVASRPPRNNNCESHRQHHHNTTRHRRALCEDLGRSFQHT